MTHTIPQLTPEQRKHLDEAYRQAISLVRTLAPVLGYPCPIVPREERNKPTPSVLTDCAILDTDK
jgi:hypothetical protein